MANEFTPINSQEEFDIRVNELYGDVKDLQGKITTITGERDANAATIADLQKQVKGYETAALKQRIAREKRIPFEMADRLSGETEEDLRKDADTLFQFIRSVNGPAPLHNPEPTVDTNDAALRQMLQEMEGV